LNAGEWQKPLSLVPLWTGISPSERRRDFQIITTVWRPEASCKPPQKSSGLTILLLHMAKWCSTTTMLAFSTAIGNFHKDTSLKSAKALRLHAQDGLLFG